MRRTKIKEIKRQESCGVFGINLSDQSCFDKLKKGAFHLQHRGPRGTGFAVVINGEIMVEKKIILAKPFFKAKARNNPELLKSQIGIVHVALLDLQPVIIRQSTLGHPIALALNGMIINRKEVLSVLKDSSFTIGSDAEFFIKLIAQEENYLKGIENIFRYVKGAFSIVLLTPEEVFAIRDPWGFKPLIIGRSSEGCAVASESVALEKSEMEIIRDVKPGEFVKIEPDGFRTLYQAEIKKRAECTFEFAYFSKTSSCIDGIPVVIARHNMGKNLAKNDEIKADMVSTFPLSGISHRDGYHLESGIPSVNIFEYNRYSDRSWTSSTRESSDEIAEEKLTINEAVVKDKNIILIDDSIFEAVQIGDWVHKLKEKGAKEIHIRISTPPVIANCPYDFPNRNNKKLITFDHNQEDIRKKIRADTLLFNTPEDFAAAIISAQKNTKNPLKPEDLCMGCLTGKFPI